MKRALLQLIGLNIGLWLIAALPVGLTANPATLPCAGAAMVLCLVPGALTLAWALGGSRRPPEEKVVVVLAGTMLRLTFAVGGGIALYFLVPTIRANPWVMLTWVLIFYLANLVAETVLVMTRLRDT